MWRFEVTAGEATRRLLRCAHSTVAIKMRRPSSRGLFHLPRQQERRPCGLPQSLGRRAVAGKAGWVVRQPYSRLLFRRSLLLSIITVAIATASAAVVASTVVSIGSFGGPFFCARSLNLTPPSAGLSFEGPNGKSLIFQGPPPKLARETR
jgi:hypothetical protein